MGLIFIEGLPCAGKSLLTKYLELKGEHTVPELGRVIKKEEFPGDGENKTEIEKIDEWFIIKETERFRKNSSGIFDRSYFTHLSYAYAYTRYKQIDSFSTTVQKYARAISQGELLLPDIIIYIDIDPLTSILRQNKKIDKSAPKALANFWRKESFLKDMSLAYFNIFKVAKNILILKIDGHQSTEEKYLSIQEKLDCLREGKILDLHKYLMISK